VSRADNIRLYAYGSESDVWWSKHSSAIEGLPKTEVFQFTALELEPLAELCNRNMELTVTLSEQQLFVSAGDQQLELSLKQLL